MGLQDELRAVIRQEATRLHTPEGIDPAQLLAALAAVESSFGLNAVPNHEPAYDEGGGYYRAAHHVRALHKTWGAWAACSYGPWQILFVTAWEMGFRGTPSELWSPSGCIEWVVRAMNARIFDKGATSVEQTADAWNSGSFQDKIWPGGYVKQVMDAYARQDLLDPFGSNVSGIGG